MDKDTEDTQENEIQFSAEQQKFIDKLVGNARVKARDKAKADAKAAQATADAETEREQLAAAAEWEKLAKHHESRVLELEPFEVEARGYRELIEGLLKDRVKALGDAAKKAVAALPESLSDTERLSWLEANEGLFAEKDSKAVGTPRKPRKVSSVGDDKGREQHRRLKL